MNVVLVAVPIVLIAAFAIVGRAALTRRRNAMHDGSYASGFVAVTDDGSVRSLTPDEVEYLNTEFLPGDGARPYIKASYQALTPDGRIGGFLHRSKLPRHTHVHPSP